MNAQQVRLMDKNLRHWRGRISKLEKMETRTPDEEEELGMRNAQMTIWAYQLKNSGDVELLENAGDMSASSGAATSESAGATAS